jgi:hypothetical protein
MTNRVLLGQRGTESGLWVTKPGKEILSNLTEDDFLLRITDKVLQVIQYGFIPQTAGSFIPSTVAIPSLNMRPLVEFDVIGWNAICLHWTSATTFDFIRAPNLPDATGDPFGPLTSGAASIRGIYYRVWSAIVA